MVKIYNGEGIILGRLAGRAAKDLLLGEEVIVLNCEKVMISGRKTQTTAVAKNRRERSGHPDRRVTISRLPERLVRRAIRGMIPWKTARGKEAFRRVTCFRLVPEQFQGKEMIVLEDAKAENLPTLKRITMGELSKNLGWKG